MLNDPRPWWGLLQVDAGRQLSVTDLIGNGTLTAETAAATWWALEHGASLFVVAGPQGAGKTTLATALLRFLPESAQLYVTSGPLDRLDVPRDEHTYLLVNELSWHLPFYLSGPAAARAFELLADGVRIVGTLHARSVAEAVEVMCYEAAVPTSTFAAAAHKAPILVLVLSAVRTANGIARRVAEVGLVRARGDSVEVQTVDAPGFETLADWRGVAAAQVQHEIRARAIELVRH